MTRGCWNSAGKPRFAGERLAGREKFDRPSGFLPPSLNAGIGTKPGNHSFRATGIAAYPKNAGTLEKAGAMANHVSTRTTQLYDRQCDEVSLDEVERIVI
jgi:hypothetical protein